MLSAPAAAPPPSQAELESTLLGVLLQSDTLRVGCHDLLQALRPAIEDIGSVAIALRDRDGYTLHVLAELGDLRPWPKQLDAQAANGTRATIDRGTDTLVRPLRANGRVAGALLFGGAERATGVLGTADLDGTFDVAAAVLYALTSRAEVELRRRSFAERSVDSILDGMAHQLANPLTGASAIAQMLSEDLANEEHRAAVQQIRDEIARTFVILQDLLEFHRDTLAQDGILDLGAAAERAVRFRGYATRELGIALTLDLAGSFLPVHVSAGALQHALLIALRFAESRSRGTANRRITVRVVDREDGTGAIEITDTGSGALPTLEPRYFDLPLTRFEHPARHGTPDTSDTPDTPDTPDAPDLGLAASLLRESGGRLELRGGDSEWDGATLALVLPVVPVESNPSHRRCQA